ncbi:hypothetical protein D1638_08545 [Muribaculaceae bacterium Z1]|nr:hypothetical protein [Muribaculaceae bacterium S4]NBI20961.1 hypothetical protein [Muribaculaceae bacterium Z1]
MSDTDEAARRGLSRPHAFKKRSVIVIIVVVVVLLVFLMFFMFFIMVVTSVREIIFIFMLHAPVGSYCAARTCQAGPDKGQQESDNISEKSLASHNQQVNVS